MEKSNGNRGNKKGKQNSMGNTYLLLKLYPKSFLINFKSVEIQTPTFQSKQNQPLFPFPQLPAILSQTNPECDGQKKGKFSCQSSTPESLASPDCWLLWKHKHLLCLTRKQACLLHHLLVNQHCASKFLISFVPVVK